VIVSYDGGAEKRGVGWEALVRRRKDDIGWLNGEIVDVRYEY
jgi:hypothetical protein